MVSGYTILSLKGEDFTVGEAKTIAGAYEVIEGTKKPILLCDFSIGGVEKAGRFITFGLSDDNFVSDATITVDTTLVRLTVTDDDELTFSEE